MLKGFVNNKIKNIDGSMATCRYLNGTTYYCLKYMSKLDPKKLILSKFHKVNKERSMSNHYIKMYKVVKLDPDT